MKLNIGAGFHPIEGWTNLDIYPSEGIDVICDLEEGKLPFDDNSVDQLFASHTLEHITNLIPLMNECWRVMKPGAVFTISVPHYPHPEAFQDPTHVRYFVPATFLYFTKDIPSGGSIGFTGEFEIQGSGTVAHELFVDLVAVK